MSNTETSPTDRPTAQHPTHSTNRPASTGRLAQLHERRARADRRRQVRRRHLLQALTGTALAVAILTGLQLYAASGIAQARQAALAARSSRVTTQTEQAQPEQATAQPAAQPEWVAEDTGAPYSPVDPSASPLSLPRCTTSPSTPLPCLATVSPNSTRVVVLEEDASMTAIVRR